MNVMAVSCEKVTTAINGGIYFFFWQLKAQPSPHAIQFEVSNQLLWGVQVTVRWKKKIQKKIKNKKEK